MLRYLQTDLAQQNPFTIALKNFGGNFSENEKGHLSIQFVIQLVARFKSDNFVLQL